MILFLLLAGTAFAQADLYFQSDLPAEEFRARWQQLYSRMGDRGIAIVQDYPKVPVFVFPRQNNEFYYLCGVETAQAYLVLDAKSRRATLLLPPRDERLERSEGRVLSASDVDFARRATGVDEVLSTVMTVAWMQARLRDSEGSLYTPFAPAEGYAWKRSPMKSAALPPNKSCSPQPSKFMPKAPRLTAREAEAMPCVLVSFCLFKGQPLSFRSTPASRFIPRPSGKCSTRLPSRRVHQKIPPDASRTPSGLNRRRNVRA